MKIYADNAATTKMSQRAIQAMLPYMSEIKFRYLILNKHECLNCKKLTGNFI